LVIAALVFEESGKRRWHMGWLQVTLISDISIHQVALQDRVGCGVKDLHKDTTDDVGRQQHHSAGEDR